MVIDTSALLAILFNEPDGILFERAITREQHSPGLGSDQA